MYRLDRFNIKRQKGIQMAVKILDEFMKSKNQLGMSVKEKEELILTLSSIDKSLKSINNRIGHLDVFYHDELPKRYGFDKDKMYYIGTASGFKYTQPIDPYFVEMIQNFDTLNWKEIQELNNYFINGTKRRIETNSKKS